MEHQHRQTLYIHIYHMDRCTTVSSVDCGLPPPIANGTVSGIGTGVGSTAYYACLDSNYTLVGNSSIVCRDDGAWEDPPMCVPVGEYMN